MRSYFHTCPTLIFLLAATSLSAQQTAPDLGSRFLDDTPESPAATSHDSGKKKAPTITAKNAEAVEKATSISGTTLETTSTVVEFAGKHFGDAEAATQAGKAIGGTGKALGNAASVAKLVGAAQKGELSTELANQGAEKLVEHGGELMGGPLGEITIGAVYKATKVFLEDTKFGQAVEAKRDKAYLTAAGAFEPIPRSEDRGPEGFQAQKSERSMKNAGLIGASDTVSGFAGPNAAPSKRPAAATNANMGPATGSGPTMDLTRSVGKAGLKTDGAPQHKIMFNTEAVTKLLGPGAPAAKQGLGDPAALKTSLDNHVTDWTLKVDQQKAEKARDDAAEATKVARDKAQLAEERAARHAVADAYIAERAAKQQAAYAAEHPHHGYTDISSRASGQSDAKGGGGQDALNGLKPLNPNNH